MEEKKDWEMMLEMLEFELKYRRLWWGLGTI